MEENGFDFCTFDFSCSEEIETETRLEQYQDFLEIQSKLKLLPTKYQEVIALKYFEGKRMLIYLVSILACQFRGEVYYLNFHYPIPIIRWASHCRVIELAFDLALSI